MEITIEEFRQEIGGLKEGQRRLELEIGKINHKIELEIGKINHKIEHEIGGLKEDLGQKIADAQAKITQWVVGLFIGTAVTMATLTGVYLAGMMLVVTR